MAKRILIKPIITEKADRLSEKDGRYSFVVNKDANKIEIKKAVAETYNVEVESVNTMIMPSKTKNRNSRRTAIRGSVSSYKKAIVTLVEGETINFFGEV